MYPPRMEAIYWVAVKEHNSSYYIGENIWVTIYTYTHQYPNLSSLTATQHGAVLAIV